MKSAALWEQQAIPISQRWGYILKWKYSPHTELHSRTKEQNMNGSSMLPLVPREPRRPVLPPDALSRHCFTCQLPWLVCNLSVKQGITPTSVLWIKGIFQMCRAHWGQTGHRRTHRQFTWHLFIVSLQSKQGLISTSIQTVHKAIVCACLRKPQRFRNKQPQPLIWGKTSSEKTPTLW